MGGFSEALDEVGLTMLGIVASVVAPVARLAQRAPERGVWER